MHLLVILLDMITVIIYSELYKLLSYLLCNEWMSECTVHPILEYMFTIKKFQILAASQTKEKVCYYKVFG